MTPKKEKIHITAIAKSALAMPIMAKWTRSNRKTPTFENGRKKASSENDLDERPKMNGDLRRQSFSTDNIAMKYKEGATPKPIIKLQNEYSDSSPVSLNSNSVRFSMETLDEEGRTDRGNEESGLIIESLQLQMRTLENDVRVFKDSLNDKISSIMQLLQDIRNENLPPYELEHLKCVKENSIEFDLTDRHKHDKELVATDIHTSHSFIDIEEAEDEALNQI